MSRRCNGLGARIPRVCPPFLGAFFPSWLWNHSFLCVCMANHYIPYVFSLCVYACQNITRSFNFSVGWIFPSQKALAAHSQTIYVKDSRCTHIEKTSFGFDTAFCVFILSSFSLLHIKTEVHEHSGRSTRNVTVKDVSLCSLLCLL